MKHLLLLSFLFVLALSQTYSEGKRIYFTNPNPVTVVFVQNSTQTTVTSCFCTVGTVATCTLTQSGTTVTFSLTVGTGGICDLRTNTGPVRNIALLDELSITPLAGLNNTNTLVTLQSTPSINFASIIRGPATISPSLNPSITFSAVGVVNYTVLASSINSILPAIQPVDNRYEVDFTLNDQGDTYPIQKPFLLYPPATISDVSPTLVRVGMSTNFIVKTTDNFVPGTKFVKVSIAGSVVDSVLVDTKTVQFTYTFATSGNFTFSLSFDGVNWFSSQTVRISAFDLPANFNATYTNPSNYFYSSEVNQGCSIFGFNNVILNLYNQIAASERAKNAPKLRISTGQVTRDTTCSWDQNVAGINCTCISFSDFRVTLPQTWSFSIQVNGNDWISTGKTITYFALEAYTISQSQKLDQAPLTNLVISNLKNRYNPTPYLYTWFLRNKANGLEQDITSFCVASSGPSFNCSTIPYLNTVDNIANNETRLNTLCGCIFAAAPCTGTLVNGTTCCIDGTCTQITQTPYCVTPCELNFVLKIGPNPADVNVPPVDHESAFIYRIFASVQLSSFIPNAVPQGTTKPITWIGNTFQNFGGFNVRFTQNKNDLYYRRLLNCQVEECTSQPVPPCVVNNCSDTSAIFNHADYFGTGLSLDSSSQFSFTSPNIATEGLFDVFFTMNSASFQKINNYQFRSFDPARFNFSYVLGDSGIGRSTPSGSNMTIFGENFFPSTQISVRYVSSLTLSSTCTFVSRTQISCKTVNAFSSGITLPSDFAVWLSPNGVDFYNTRLNITYLKSDVPVIVQLIPQRGPINPEEGPYPVTIKGITPTGIDKCIFTSPNGTEFQTNIVPGSLTSDQVICNAPTNNIFTGIGRYAVQIFNSITNVKSDASNAFFEFYLNPIIKSITPPAGQAIGGVPLLLSGSGFNVSITGYQIRFKLGDTQTSQPCTLISDTSVSCVTPAHPENNNLKVYISYNENQFASSNTTYQSLACLPGFSAKDFETPCVSCKRGFFKPSVGFFECISCGIGTYQGELGASSCLLCPARTSTVSDASRFLSDCDCSPGSYRKNNTSPGIECSECPEGGICKGRANFPAPKPGFWWNKDTSPANDWKFDQCDVEKWCTGNVTENNGCEDGRDGIKCASCKFGYYRSGQDCKICENDIRWRMVVILIVVIILLLLIFKFAQLKVSHLSSISIAVSYYQIIAVFTAYNFKWPPELKDALNILKFLNLDLDIFVPECIAEITWGMKWYATLAFPILFAVLLIIFFFLEVFRSLLTRLWGPSIHERVGVHFFKIDPKMPWYLKFLKSLQVDLFNFIFTTKTNKQIYDFLDSVIHTYVIILSFSYVFVITKASQIFNCSRSQPMFMYGDTKFICWQGDWWQFFPFAILTLAIFGGGVIILFLYIACNRKKALTSRVFNARFRFLFVRFRDERIYWEVIIILRKLAISCAVIFFSGGQSEMLVVLFAMLVIFIAFILQTHNYPFRRKFHNLMEYFVLLSTEFLLFSALLFYVDEFPDAWNKPALGWICIITVCATSVFVFLLMIADFIDQWREDRENRKKELEALENRPLESQDPLMKFKEKRRQLTTYVDISLEEKEKEEQMTQQKINIEVPVEEKLKNEVPVEDQIKNEVPVEEKIVIQEPKVNDVLIDLSPPKEEPLPPVEEPKQDEPLPPSPPLTIQPVNMDQREEVLPETTGQRDPMFRIQEVIE